MGNSHNRLSLARADEQNSGAVQPDLNDQLRVFSFAPVAHVDAKILVLGSMPGVASLNAQQYYAHPRNLFWPLMAQLLQFDAGLDYPVRTQQLASRGVALWDVLQSCQREGSLDSQIQAEIPNDFPAFLDRHRQIRAIFFNGEKAASSFRKSVLPLLNPLEIPMIRLPSTSPANAGQSLTMKYQAWHQILDYLSA